MGCSLQETDLHLLLKGKMLLNVDDTVYDSHIENGDVLEMVMSSHETISKVLQSQARVKNEMDYVVGVRSLLASRILFLQLAYGSHSLPWTRAAHYLSKFYDEGVIAEVLSSLPSSQELSENAFVVAVQLLEHDFFHTHYTPSSVTQLLLVPLSPIHCAHEEGIIDERWLCSYQDVHSILAKLTLEELMAPWTLDWSVLRRCDIQDAEVDAM